MALEVGTFEEKTREYPLVVGTAVLAPVALNPTLEQLIELGVVPADSKQEPKYMITGTNSNKDWRIVSIWLSAINNVLNTKTNKTEQVKVMAELKFMLAKEAGPLYINDEGRFAGEAKKGNLGASARLEHQGEHKLIDFVKCLARVGQGKKCSLDNIEDLIHKGDTSELGDMLRQSAEAGFQVRVALGVENSQFQRVHTESFAMDNANSLTYFYSQLAKQSPYAGDAYYGSFFEDASTLQVIKATELRFYNEIEALEHEDKKQQRKAAASVNANGAPRPVGGAPAPPAPGMPSASQEEAMYQPRVVGGPLANAAAGDTPTPTAAPPMPIGSDDDNDLPF